MNEEDRKNIIEIFSESVKAIEEDDIVLLRELSDRTIKSASIHQDRYSVSVAILIYSLAKVYERGGYRNLKTWDRFDKGVRKLLNEGRDALEKEDLSKFDSVLTEFFSLIDRLDKKIKKYIKDVFEKAKISKASRLYEHGISLGRTAEILGISAYDLMDYVGKTYIGDVKESITLGVPNRLRFIRGLFK